MQYVTAEWDYVAEGESELSFKEGDRIRLLEKHNDDWWEGELDEKIGFFPANRTYEEHEEENREIMSSQGSSNGELYSLAPPLPSQPNPSRSLIDLSADLPPPPPPNNDMNGNGPAVREGTTRPLLQYEEEIERNLPFGWSIAFDDVGTIYYFNEFTGESSWDVPGSAVTSPESYVNSPVSDPSTVLPLRPANRGISPVSFEGPDEEEGAGGDGDDELASMVIQKAGNQSAPITDAGAEEAAPTTEEISDLELTNGHYDLSLLQLDRLPAEWIHRQGYAQMKAKAERPEDSNRLSGWKMYWIVLCSGFLLFYKDSKEKLKKSGKSTTPVLCYDLANCDIGTAQKLDTKRKNVFIVTLPSKIKLFVQMQNPEETSMWLDGVMRDLVARREGGGQPNIVKLLHKQASDHDNNSGKSSHQKKLSGGTSSTKEKPLSTPPRPVSTPPLPKKEKEGPLKGFRKPPSVQAKSKSSADQPPTESKKIGGWLRKAPRASLQSSEIKNTGAFTEKGSMDRDLIFGGLLNLVTAGVPEIVEICIRAVDERGLSSVGIYRLSGPSAAIQKYRAAINAGESVDISKEQDINAVTSLLKLYFRELQNPLLTHDFYEYFLEAGRIKTYDDRMFQIKALVHALPPAHYTTLRYLMQHLSRVASHSEENKMEASNLAIVFSPNLLSAEVDDALESMRNAGATNTVIEALILQPEWFFEEEEEAFEERMPEGTEKKIEENVRMGPSINVEGFGEKGSNAQDAAGKMADPTKPAGVSA